MSTSKALRQVTLKEYNSLSGDYRGIWTTERWDITDWAAKREKYVGMRTMTVNEDGQTVLLVEGLHFEIVDDSKSIPRPLKTFKNVHYDPKASYECTVLIFCQAVEAPSVDWIPCAASEINCRPLYVENDVRYFGRL